MRSKRCLNVQSLSASSISKETFGETLARNVSQTDLFTRVRTNEKRKKSEDEDENEREGWREENQRTDQVGWMGEMSVPITCVAGYALTAA